MQEVGSDVPVLEVETLFSLAATCQSCSTPASPKDMLWSTSKFHRMSFYFLCTNCPILSGFWKIQQGLSRDISLFEREFSLEASTIEVENSNSELTMLLTELLSCIFHSLVHSAILSISAIFYIPNTCKIYSSQIESQVLSSGEQQN